jgi:hypothetical protein
VAPGGRQSHGPNYRAALARTRSRHAQVLPAGDEFHQSRWDQSSAADDDVDDKAVAFAFALRLPPRSREAVRSSSHEEMFLGGPAPALRDHVGRSASRRCDIATAAGCGAGGGDSSSCLWWWRLLGRGKRSEEEEPAALPPLLPPP